MSTSPKLGTKKNGTPDVSTWPRLRPRPCVLCGNHLRYYTDAVLCTELRPTDLVVGRPKKMMVAHCRGYTGAGGSDAATLDGRVPVIEAQIEGLSKQIAWYEQGRPYGTLAYEAWPRDVQVAYGTLQSKRTALIALRPPETGGNYDAIHDWAVNVFSCWAGYCGNRVCTLACCQRFANRVLDEYPQCYRSSDKNS